MFFDIKLKPAEKGQINPTGQTIVSHTTNTLWNQRHRDLAQELPSEEIQPEKDNTVNSNDTVNKGKKPHKSGPVKFKQIGNLYKSWFTSLTPNSNRKVPPGSVNAAHTKHSGKQVATAASRSHSLPRTWDETLAGRYQPTVRMGLRQPPHEQHACVGPGWTGHAGRTLRAHSLASRCAVIPRVNLTWGVASGCP